MTSGIYEIVNLVTGKRYIGSAVNIEKRWRDHRYDLRHKIHANEKLQNSWNKHGETSFEFNILFQCSPVKNILLFYEQLWIDMDGGIKYLYNINPFAKNSSGAKLSQSTKNKISLYRTGRNHSPDTIEKIKNKSNNKMIYQIDLSGNIVRSFISINDASRETGISQRIIYYSLYAFHRCGNYMFILDTSHVNFALQNNLYKKHASRLKKKIYQISISENKVIAVYDSIRDVEHKLGYNCTLLSRCARKLCKKSYGFIWRYVEDTNYQIGDIYPV